MDSHNLGLVGQNDKNNEDKIPVYSALVEITPQPLNLKTQFRLIPDDTHYVPNFYSLPPQDEKAEPPAKSATPPSLKHDGYPS